MSTHRYRVDCPPGDSRLHSPALAQAHRAVINRRRVLVCDVESQSLHALRIVFRQAIARRGDRAHGREATSFVLEVAGRYTAADLDLVVGAGFEDGLCAIA